jgi:hypothetical protein
MHLIPLMYIYCDIFTYMFRVRNDNPAISPMAGLSVEMFSWKCHDKYTSVDLSACCWFLIDIIQISARNMERIKKCTS